MVARIDLACAHWRKSSYSAQGQDCIELASASGGIAVRDSKDPHGPALIFSGADWSRFTRRIKSHG